MNSQTLADSKPVSNGAKRWFNFSLKALLVVTTALAIFLGLYVKSFRDRRTKVAAIERVGGEMGVFFVGPELLRNLVDDEKYFWDPASVSFKRPLSVSELEGVLPHLMSCRRFDDLTLTISDENLHLLLPLADKLTRLDLSGSPISDAAVTDLKRFTKLEFLALWDVDLTAGGIRALEEALPSCVFAARFARR